MKLLKSWQVDRLFRYSAGRSEELAREGKLPFVQLPDGEIRFDSEQIRSVLANGVRQVSDAMANQEVAHA